VADHIPFITSRQALRLARSIYGDSSVVRVGLDLVAKLNPDSNRVKLWIDPGFDGLHDLSSRLIDSAWYKIISSIQDFAELSKPAFIGKPNPSIVESFVNALLDRCLKQNPHWITVPQLPAVNDSVRNKINRELARATGKWKSSRKFAGRLILPLIFTHQEQTRGKTQRNPKLEQAHRCYDESQADGIWTVDTSIPEETRSVTIRNTRFKANIDLHKELNDTIPSRIRIAGPYWGMNLLLWARGLIDYPAIGIGSTYQYYMPGGHSNPASARVAISPLRRRVSVEQLNIWLTETLKIIGASHPDFPELDKTRRQWTVLNDEDTARQQVATFYKRWFDTIAATPAAGRSLGLFQDLSRAFALGRSLPDFVTEDAARSAESVVEPLMINCL
jgi:hypothetical protein